MVEVEDVKNLNYKKKLTFLRLSRLALIMLFSFFVLFFIGLNSDYLIKPIIKYICLTILMVSFVLFIVYTIKYFKIKDVKLPKKRFIMNTLTSLYCRCS